MSDDLDQAQALDLARIEAVQRFCLDRARRYGETPAGLIVFCQVCGDEIDPRRVLAIPGTKRCVDCQGVAEARTHRDRSLA